MQQADCSGRSCGRQHQPEALGGHPRRAFAVIGAEGEICRKPRSDFEFRRELLAATGAPTRSPEIASVADRAQDVCSHLQCVRSPPHPTACGSGRPPQHRGASSSRYGRTSRQQYHRSPYAHAGGATPPGRALVLLSCRTGSPVFRFACRSGSHACPIRRRHGAARPLAAPAFARRMPVERRERPWHVQRGDRGLRPVTFPLGRGGPDSSETRLGVPGGLVEIPEGRGTG
jgi:hypothetical protein